MVVNELGKDSVVMNDDDEPNTDIDFYVDKVIVFASYVVTA